MTLGGRRAHDRAPRRDRRAPDHPAWRAARIATAREALRGQQLHVDGAALPALGPDEWWAEELEGARVFDGERELGVVRRLLALPSCECLEVARAGGGADLLVPLVRDAVRAVDVGARADRRRPALPRGGRVKIDVVTLFPAWFDWFRTQRHVANALGAGQRR